MPLRDGRLRKNAGRITIPSAADRHSAIAAVAWCAGLALAGSLWARVPLRRDLNR